MKLINIRYDIDTLNKLGADDVENMVADIRRIMDGIPGVTFIFTPFIFDNMGDEEITSNMEAMIDYLVEHGRKEWLKEFLYNLVFDKLAGNNDFSEIAKHREDKNLESNVEAIEKSDMEVVE